MVVPLLTTVGLGPDNLVQKGADSTRGAARGGAGWETVFPKGVFGEFMHAGVF